MSSQVASLMSKVSLIVYIITQKRLLIHVNGSEEYPVQTIFKDDYESLTHGSSWEEINCLVHKRLFNHRRKLFILQMDAIGHQIKMCHV